MPRLALFGEWTTANLGDRAIFVGVKDFASRAGWATRSFSLGSLVPVDDDVPLSATRQPGLSRSLRARVVPPRIHRSARGARQYHRGRTLIPHLKDCQAILVGGGALLTDYNLHFPQSLLAVTRAAQRLSLPLLCLGCSSEASLSDRGQRLLKDFLERCILIGARDGESQRLVEKLVSGPEVRVFGDFALDPFQTPNLGSRTNRETVLAVNVMRLPANASRSQVLYESVLVAIATEWMKQHQGRVEVFTTGAPDDFEPAVRVREGVESLIEDRVTSRNPTTVAELKSNLGAAQIVVAGRLHAAILALSVGTPAVGVSVGPKIGNYYSTIGLQRFHISALDRDAVTDATRLMLDPALGVDMFTSLDLSAMNVAWKHAIACLGSIADVTRSSNSH